MEEMSNDFYEKWNELRLCVINNDRDGLMRFGYKMYMRNKVEKALPIELNSIGMMAFDTRIKKDALNNAIYYFDTIGDYSKANDLLEIKQIIQGSFRKMVNLLKINKSQFN